MPADMKCVFICLRHITVCVRYTILKRSNRGINIQREKRHLIVHPMFSVPSGNECQLMLLNVTNAYGMHFDENRL